MTTTQKKIKKLASKCLKMWYDIGMIEHDFVCQACGKRATQAHHYFFKGTFPHLKYEPTNNIPLCVSCHARLHFKDSKIVEKQIIETNGKRWLTKLEKKAYQKPQPKCPKTLAYLQSIYEKLLKHLTYE